MSSSSSSGSSGLGRAGRGRGGRRGVAVPVESRPGAVGGESENPPPRGSPPRSPKRDSDEEELVKKAEGLEITHTVMQRPGYGKLGRPITLQANYFELRVGATKKASLVVHRYQISFGEMRRKLDKDDQRMLFWHCVKENPRIFKNKYAMAYDDSSACYTIDDLPFEGGKKIFKFDMEFQLETDNRPNKYSVEFKFTGKHLVDLGQTVQDPAGGRPMDPVQIVDIIINQGKRYPFAPNYNMWYPWGRGVYRQPGNGNRTDLGAGREMWTGYQAAARVGQGWKPLLNVDVSNSAFYRRQPLLEFMCQTLTENSSGGGRNRATFSVSQLDANTTLDQGKIDTVKRALKGMRIKTTHLEHNRTYKFKDMVGNPRSLRFTKKDGTELTVEQHYTSSNHPLRYPGLSCIAVGSRQHAQYYPMEVLEIAAPQKVKTKLTDKQTSVMIRASARPAPDRKSAIESLVQGITPMNNPDPFMKEFQIQLNLQMVDIQARILEPQRMHYAKGKTTNVRDGVWDQAGEFFKPASVRNYSLISFENNREQPLLEKFCKNLMLTAQMLGMEISTVWPDSVDYIRRSEDVEGTMKKIQKNCKANGTECDLILVVMPWRDANNYSEVKRWAEIELPSGVMTQCVLTKNAKTVAERPPGPNAATAINIAMKINVKRGGINVHVESVWHKLTGKNEKATLFLGVDVTHPGARDVRSPSIGCVVGNVNLEATRWGASVKVQKHRREAMVYMQNEARDRIVNFFQITGFKPSRIVIYRDGVSEGQFQEVLREEMEGIRRACQDLDTNYKPPITFIVVQKRHHTRFFCKNPQDGKGKSRNIPPGTVVDTGVTHPSEFDFYLCSHAGIQGTSRPTHYYVLHDENGFNADSLQIATYQLCHLFGRCNRVVSIPAPVYYADLCCTRARYHVRHRTGIHTSEGSSQQDDSTSNLSDHDLRAAVTVVNNMVNQMYYI